jgi:hypothetical protein
MNIGGTGGSPTWDGETSPRLKLTAVPYAFRAGQLAKLTGGNTSTLDFATQTAARSILLPDEGGTLCIRSSTQCGFATGGGAAFIQGGNSFGTAAILGTADNNALTFITNNTEKMRLTTGGVLQVNSTGTVGTVEKFRVNTPTTVDNNAVAIISAANTTDKILVLQAVASQSANVLTVQDSGGTGLAVITASGAIQGKSGSTSSPGLAFISENTMGFYRPSSGILGVTINAEVARFDSAGLMIGSTGTRGTVEKFRISAPATVDNLANAIITTSATTSKGLVVQGIASQSANIFEVQNSSGAGLFTVSSAGALTAATGTLTGANTLTLGQTGTNTGSILFKGSTGASGTITLIGQNNPGTRTITLPDETGTVCTNAVGGTCSSFFQASGNYLQQVPASTAINTVTPTAASTVGLTVNATSNATSAVAAIFNQANNNSTPDTVQINSTNTAATQTNALLVNRNGASGTTTNGIQIQQTAGTLTNGLTLSGTMTNGINFSGTGFTKLVSAAGAASGTLTSTSASLIDIVPTRTHTGATSITDSGNFLNLTRANTINNASGTFNVTGALANLQSNCTVTAGTCADSANILKLNQQYASATGDVLSIQDAGTGNSTLINKTGSSGDILRVQKSGVDALRVGNVGTVAIGNGASPLSIIAVGVSHTFGASDNCAVGCFGLNSNPVINNPTNPTGGVGISTTVQTGASAFTLGSTIGLRVGTAVAGAGSTITANYGILVDPQGAGGTDFGVAIGAADTQTLWVSNNADNTTASAGIAFGLSRDTNLYRSAANILKTDDSFEIASSAAVGTSVASNVGLNVAKVFAAATTAEDYGQLVSTTFAAADTGFKQGLRLDTVSSLASGTLANMMGVFALNTTAGSGATTTNSYSYYARNDVLTGHTLQNAYGLYVNNGSAAGTMTNQYGVLVAPLTSGASDYGIAIGAADTQTLWVSNNADNTSAAAGIAFGSSRDTNLYRSAANVLMTDDTLTVATGLKVNSTGSPGTVEKLRVNAPSTVDNSANAIITTSATTSKGLVVQGIASQSGSLIEGQDSSGAALFTVGSNGTVTVGSGGVTNTIQAGQQTIVSGNASTPIFTVDSTGGAKSFRLRNNGTDVLSVTQAGNMAIGTSSTASFRLDVIDNQASTYVSRIQNTNTANTADGLLIDLGVANASRGTGNYFVGFAGAGTVAGKIQGGASAVAYTTTAADYAEYFKADPNNLPQPGELVMLSQGQSQHVLKSDSSMQTPLVGVVSTNPGFIGNGPLCNIGDEDCDTNYAKYNALVALSGQVPVKVNTSHGPINTGDPIVASDTKGEGAKAIGAGYIVGYAMQPLAGGKGTIKVLIRPQYNATGVSNMQGESLNVSGDAKVSGDLNISGQATVSSLTVSNAIESNTLKVRGATYTGSLTVATLITTKDLTVINSVTAKSLKIQENAEFEGDIVLAGSINTKQNAITKKFKASGAITPGSVVVLDPTADGLVMTPTIVQDTKIIGVAVSAATNKGDDIMVAIGGQVQVAAEGTITAGDLLVTGATAGNAKAEPNPHVGSVLGKATSQKDANNKVWILLTLQ